MRVKLKEIYLFQDLCEETLEKIESFTSSIKLFKNNILFYEGDRTENLFFLRQGIIKLYKTSSNDKEIILKYFHSNEFIAEVANFEEIPYPATAQAFTECEVLKINFEKLKEIIFKDSKLSYIIQASIIKKIRNLENLISMHVVLDSKERLAKYLCEHTQSFFNTKNIIVAEILNMSPETLSRMLKFFRDEKLIDIKNKTVDKDKLGLFYLNKS